MSIHISGTTIKTDGPAITVPKGADLNVVNSNIQSRVAGIEERENSTTLIEVNGGKIIIPGHWSQRDVLDFLKCLSEKKGEDEIANSKIGQFWKESKGAIGFAADIATLTGLFA